MKLPHDSLAGTVIAGLVLIAVLSVVAVVLVGN